MALNTYSRRQKITELIRAEGFCSVTTLSETLSVSEVTIRTDLTALEIEGTITRLHGGAIPVINQGYSKAFEERTHINEDKKRRIARYAAEIIEDFDNVVLDASTTTFHMAGYLSNRQGLTAFTNGVEVGFRLAAIPGSKVILTGGLLRPQTASLGTEFGEGLLNGVHVSKAFLSCTGVNAALELMDDDLFEIQTKKAMVECADTVIVIVDSTKFERQGLASFAHISRVSMIITDDQISESALTTLQQTGVPLMICSDHSTRVYNNRDAIRKIRIGFANQDDTAPFSTLVRQSMIEAAKANKIDLLMTDNREDGTTALANADYFVSEAVDLVVEFNTDVRFGNAIMDKLRSANIPVIAIDIPLPGATFFGADNYKAGRMAGQLLGKWVQQHWQSQVDVVISLDLPLSGPVPQARLQGQLDGFKDFVAVEAANIIHLDSKNTLDESYHAVAKVLPALKGTDRIAVIGVNDETIAGAQHAFMEAGIMDRMVTVSMGADANALRELQRSDSRLIGAVALFPERYGQAILSIATQLLQGKAIPPAVYTNHVVVLSPDTSAGLDIAALGFDTVTVEDYLRQQQGVTMP